MKKEPETIDEILDALVTKSHNSVAKGDSIDFTLRYIAEANAALSAMVAEIIGEDENRNHRYNKNWRTEVDAQNYLRKQQCQRAIAKGFDIKGVSKEEIEDVIEGTDYNATMD